MYSRKLQFGAMLSCCLMVLLACTLTTVKAASISQIGDVEIYSNETHFKCDRIFCPPTAQRCQVLKEKQHNNSTLVRRNICFTRDDSIVKQKTYTDTVNKKGEINLNMNSYRNGFSSTIQSGFVNANSNVPNGELQKQLDFHINNAQRINSDLQQQLGTINEDIAQNVQNMNQQLQQQLQATLQNIF